MAAKTFLRTGAGNELIDVVAGTQVSAGAANGGDIVSLKDDGTLDVTMMPTGIGADTSIVVASENLAAGNLINLWNDSGTLKARKADATVTGKTADGYVIASFNSGQNATIYHDGTNTNVTGLTPGRQWLSTTPGECTAVKPTGSGNVQQIVGIALNATSMTFEPGDATIRLS